MHPKSEVLADPSSIRQVLDKGWVGQMKVNGHRAQIHIPSDKSQAPIAYTRQGKRHMKVIPPVMASELFRLFRPTKGWNAIDAEWVKDDDKLFVFDFLKKDGETLWLRTYPERYKLLPRTFLSPHISILPLLRELDACLKVLNSADSHVEGLVFKSMTSAGFSDTSIVRCRRR